MQTYDPQKAARVWKRVQSAQIPEEREHPADNLKELILNEWVTAATYAQLARQLQHQSSALQTLSREDHAHGACLRGMYSLKTGEKCPVHMPKPEKEPPEITLRRCYGLEMRSLKAYEARSEDPEYGHVFAKLAEQEQEHCMVLLRIIGSLEKN